MSDSALSRMMRKAGSRMDAASEIMQRTAHGATQYNQRMPQSVFPEATKENYDRYQAASRAFRTARTQTANAINRTQQNLRELLRRSDEEGNHQPDIHAGAETHVKGGLEKHGPLTDSRR
mgnify:CR=1 FL=1